jgi:hypothetical protein
MGYSLLTLEEPLNIYDPPAEAAPGTPYWNMVVVPGVKPFRFSSGGPSLILDTGLIGIPIFLI